MATVKRGTLLTFDSATYLAQVLLDGADVESEIPVGEWVPPGQLVASAEVAVLSYDHTNTDDGVVLGAYGSVWAWTLPSLNIGSPESAGAGELHASGDLQSESAGSGEPHVRFYRPGGSAGHMRIRLGYTADDAFIVQALNDNGAFQADMFKVFRSGGGDTALTAGNLNLAGASLVYKVNGTQVLGARKTGWSAWTGTATRSSKATTTATLANVAEALKALLDDLISHGVIGA